MDRKKELKLQYKQTRPQMGIFTIRSKVNNKCYLQAAQDLRGVMNGARVRLELPRPDFILHLVIIQ